MKTSIFIESCSKVKGTARISRGLDISLLLFCAREELAWCIQEPANLPAEPSTVESDQKNLYHQIQ